MISLAVVFLLLLNGTSHDFIHQFTGHTDTIDCKHNDDSGTPNHAWFEQEHHHCHFLDLEAPLFLHPAKQLLPDIILQQNGFFQPGDIAAIALNLPHTSLRGPPRIS